MKDFAGRTAFITGGASGIGLALARALLAEGCKVAIADVRADHLDAAMSSLGNQNVLPLQLDIAARADFSAAADRAEAALGPVSLLFNNAGVNLFLPIDECTYDDWDWVLGVNLQGVIHGVQTFVPRMKARGQGGHVVNTASMASFLAGPITGIYNVSKFAVRGLSESLRYSLAPQGIGVSVLCPGLVNSAIHDSDRSRPSALPARGKPVDEGFNVQLARAHQAGMSPDEVADKTLAAIRRNQFYVFSHPEFKDELGELFAEIVAEFSDEAAPPARAAFEAQRRASYKAARVAARGE